MKKTILLLLFNAFFLSMYGNMGRPYIDGTYAKEIYSAGDIDIIREDLYIRITDHRTAFYNVIYTISPEQDSIRIPLLFDTVYDEVLDFTVWLNEVKVEIKDIPEEWKNENVVAWDNFIQNYTGEFYGPASDRFRYIELELMKGVHTIRVSYQAQPSIKLSGWVNEYIFHYNLEPARSWRSFSNLNFTVEVDSRISPVVLNIDNQRVKVDSLYVLHFDQLPGISDITISYTPGISLLARLFVAITPVGFACIALIILVVLQLYFIYKSRQKNLQRRFSWKIIIPGSLLIPIVGYLVFMFSYLLIDMVIGSEATNFHGYAFLIVLYYPIQMPLHLIFMIFADLRIKKYLCRKADSKQ